MSLAISVHFLSGVYYAAEESNRQRAEWPPHPARLFSALVAAAHEAKVGTVLSVETRNALLALENLGPPEVHASGAEVRRTNGPSSGPATVFVPVNDGSLHSPGEAEPSPLKATLSGGAAASARDLSRAGELLPNARGRKDRRFPSVAPHVALVAFVWPEANLGAAEFNALTDLCARVPRLGHSASLVAVTASAEQGQPATSGWTPDADGELALRWVAPGQLERLEALETLHAAAAVERSKGRLPSIAVTYRPIGEVAAPRLAQSVFANRQADWIVFERLGGARLDVRHTGALMRQFRQKFLQAAGRSLSPVLGGHSPAGQPTDQPHLAFVPLPHVGFNWADGDLRGIAIIPPRNLSVDDQLELHEVVRQLVRETRLHPSLGLLESADRPDFVLSAWDNSPPTAFALNRSLAQFAATDAARWSSPSRDWATVTPIVLGRYPGELFSRDSQTAARAQAEAHAWLAESLARAGVCTDFELVTSAGSFLRGVPESRKFPPYIEKDGRKRVHFHAKLRFAEPVVGPLIVGVGRHFGLGLLCPIDSA